MSSLYSFTTVGQKIEWMRANPLVCVEADEVVSPQQWVSVIVFGRYEELPDTPEWQSARAFAHTLLKQTAVWWEPAYVKTIHCGTQRPLVPVFYRIHVVQITGHRATPEPVTPSDARPSMPDSGEAGWLQDFCGRSAQETQAVIMLGVRAADREREDHPKGARLFMWVNVTPAPLHENEPCWRPWLDLAGHADPHGPRPVSRPPSRRAPAQCGRPCPVSRGGLGGVTDDCPPDPP